MKFSLRRRVDGQDILCGTYDTHADALAIMDKEGPKTTLYIKREEDKTKPGPSAMLTQALRDTLALEEGQSPLTEASPISLDELYDRINRKLVQGLVLDIHDGDILAIVTDLRAQRLRWVQEQQRNDGKPRKRTPRSVADALSQVSAGEIEI